MLKLSQRRDECRALMEELGGGDAGLEYAAQHPRVGPSLVVAALGARGRGLHSSTFRLNVSALCEIGGAFRACLGDSKGCIGYVVCQKRHKLS